MSLSCEAVDAGVLLHLRGYVVAQVVHEVGGAMSLFMALFWTTLGSVAVALITYWLGARLGRDRVRSLIIRAPLMKPSDFDRTEHWFLKHGTKAVFFGRMVPLFRSLVSLPRTTRLTSIKSASSSRCGTVSYRGPPVGPGPDQKSPVDDLS